MKYNWRRLIAHVDMDAFFASIEQSKDPTLIGKPLVVTSNPMSKTIVAASYEAKALGCVVGTKIPPNTQVFIKHADLDAYRALSDKIMATLNTFTPSIEIFSIDEAYLDLSGMHHIYPSEISLIEAIQSTIYHQFKITCSIGLGENKSLAKVASKVNKPHGYYIIPPKTGRAYLANKPVDTLCGVGIKMKHFLNKHGVINCGDITRIPISLLSTQFGEIGRRIYYMCLGKGPHELNPPPAMPKSMGTSKMIKPTTYSYNEIHPLLDGLCYKLAYRLRSKGLYAQKYSLTLYHHKTAYVFKYQTPNYTHYHDDIRMVLKSAESLTWPLFITRIAIRTADITNEISQDLFSNQGQHIEDVMDLINQRWNKVSIKRSSSQ